MALRIARSPARSAAVTGSNAALPPLLVTARALRKKGRIAAPDRSARVWANSRCALDAAARSVITAPPHLPDRDTPRRGRPGEPGGALHRRASLGIYRRLIHPITCLARDWLPDTWVGLAQYRLGALGAPVLGLCVIIAWLVPMSIICTTMY